MNSGLHACTACSKSESSLATTSGANTATFNHCYPQSLQFIFLSCANFTQPPLLKYPNVKPLWLQVWVQGLGSHHVNPDHAADEGSQTQFLSYSVSYHDISPYFPHLEHRMARCPQMTKSPSSQAVAQRGETGQEVWATCLLVGFTGLAIIQGDTRLGASEGVSREV